LLAPCQESAALADCSAAYKAVLPTLSRIETSRTFNPFGDLFPRSPWRIKIIFFT
jgi:hypothetical protein